MIDPLNCASDAQQRELREILRCIAVRSLTEESVERWSHGAQESINIPLISALRLFDERRQ
jgi:hypothetical protein